jgi:cyclic pyranopterin phosphate synthase
MVDVGAKDWTRREAVARGEIRLNPAAWEALRQGSAAKGDVLGVARTAGIMAAKRTPELIPLCHQLALSGVRLNFMETGDRLGIEARVTVTGPTGAEMEALTAVSVAALTVYDMLKAVDRGMVIGPIRLLAKSGGKSGEYRREGKPSETG